MFDMDAILVFNIFHLWLVETVDAKAVNVGPTHRKGTTLSYYSCLISSRCLFLTVLAATELKINHSQICCQARASFPFTDVSLLVGKGDKLPLASKGTNFIQEDSALMIKSLPKPRLLIRSHL